MEIQNNFYADISGGIIDVQAIIKERNMKIIEQSKNDDQELNVNLSKDSLVEISKIEK